MTIKHQIIQSYGITINDVREYYESIKDTVYQKAFNYLYDKWIWVSNGTNVVLTESIQNGSMFGINKSKSTLLRALRDEKLPTSEVIKIIAFFESGKVKRK